MEDKAVPDGIHFEPFACCEAQLDPRMLQPPERRPITEEDEARWAEQSKGTQLEGITLRVLEEIEPRTQRPGEARADGRKGERRREP